MIFKTVCFVMMVVLAAGCADPEETADSSIPDVDGPAGADSSVDGPADDLAWPKMILDSGPDTVAPGPDAQPLDQGSPDVTTACPSTPPAAGSPCKSYPGTSFLACDFGAHGLICACISDKWDCAPKKP